MTELTFWERPGGRLLRWVAFVPAGIVTCVVSNVALLWFLTAAAKAIGMPTWEPWLWILSAGYAGWFGVALGAVLAPRGGRRIASVILATLIGFIGATAAVVNAMDHHWAMLIASIVMAGAAVVGSASIYGVSPETP